ncbi:MAG TPA: outer membrane protein assembly factor BamD [Polyangiaceae bacterium]|nr:outer membrane protein assembly factor BamD [Polyangiaceae bacterium]
MSSDPRPSALLRELANEEPPAEGFAPARARRERTVAHLRGLQARAAVRREISTSFRNRLLVAAALLIPSAALGASLLPWSPFVRAARVERSPAPAASAAEQHPRRTADRARRTAIAPAVADTASPAEATSAAPEATDAPAPQPEPAPSPSESKDAPAPQREPSRAPLGEKHRGAPSRVQDSSTLADENRLMQTALAAARDGQNGRAVRLFSEFLERHPASPLAQNAQVERFRALLRSGDGRSAARAASAYLNQYPNGMAADEARRVVARARDVQNAASF